MVTVVLEINKSSFSAPGGSSKDSVGGEAGVPVVRLETRSTSMTAGLFFLLSLEERLHLSVWLSLRGLHRKTCEPQRHSSQVVPWLSFPQAGAAAHVAGSISRKQRPCG